MATRFNGNRKGSPDIRKEIGQHFFAVFCVCGFHIFLSNFVSWSCWNGGGYRYCYALLIYAVVQYPKMCFLIFVRKRDHLVVFPLVVVIEI